MSSKAGFIPQSPPARPRPLVRLGVALVVVTVALGATSCGDRKDGSTSNRPATSAGRTSAGQTSVGSASPRRLHAADYVLTAGPATAGLTGAEGKGDENTSLTYALRGRAGQCLGVSTGDLGPAAIDQKTGLRFVSTTSGTDGTVGRTAVSSTAAVYSSAGTVAAHRDIVHRERFAACYGQLVLAEIDEPGTAVLASRVARPPTGASDRVSVTISDDSQGDSFRYYVDIVLFFRDRVESSVTVAQANEPATDTVLNRLSEHLYGKITRQ